MAAPPAPPPCLALGDMEVAECDGDDARRGTVGPGPGDEGARQRAEADREGTGAAPGDRPVIGFGRDGKPFYFSGPYDNPRKVVQTLERTCGPGNYDYVAHL